MNQNDSLLKNLQSDTQWSSIYRVAVTLSILMLLIIPLQIIIFAVSPPPQTVEQFFSLYHQNWLSGLLSLDLLYIFNNIFIIFIYLALFFRLFKENPALNVMALVLGLVGIACYFSSNPAFEMLTLASKYFNALPADQGYFIAAGESLLAGYSGTSFNVYYIVNAVVLLLFSGAILKSQYFNRTIGIWGILSGILMLIPSSAGMIGIVFSLLSLIPWVVFLIMLIKRFRAFSIKYTEIAV